MGHQGPGAGRRHAARRRRPRAARFGRPPGGDLRAELRRRGGAPTARRADRGGGRHRRCRGRRDLVSQRPHPHLRERRPARRAARRRHQERHGHRHRHQRRPRSRRQQPRRADHSGAGRDDAARPRPRRPHGDLHGTDRRRRPGPHLHRRHLAKSPRGSRHRPRRVTRCRAPLHRPGDRPGVDAARELYLRSRELGVQMPITTEVYRVLHEGVAPTTAVESLLSREPGRE